jgi:hypothetical protein
MTRKGNWVHVITEKGPAWQLFPKGEMPYDCWLRLRTGITYCANWCSYCYTPPYQWWQMVTVPVQDWLTDHSERWYWTGEGQWIALDGRRFLWQGPQSSPHLPGHGYCTHRHYLNDAMPVAEKAYDEIVLRSLAS